MRSNIDRTRRKLENRPETQSVHIDGTSDEAILRAVLDDVTDDFETFVEDELNAEMNRHPKFVGIGMEVELV